MVKLSVPNVIIPFAGGLAVTMVALLFSFADPGQGQIRAKKKAGDKN
jgi:hypothetical protein